MISILKTFWNARVEIKSNINSNEQKIMADFVRLSRWLSKHYNFWWKISKEVENVYQNVNSLVLSDIKLLPGCALLLHGEKFVSLPGWEEKQTIYNKLFTCRLTNVLEIDMILLKDIINIIYKNLMVDIDQYILVWVITIWVITDDCHHGNNKMCILAILY